MIMSGADRSNECDVITARISGEAAEGWRSFCALNGISVTALIEVLGLYLAAKRLPANAELQQRIVEDARKIDRQRRSRKK